MARLSGFRGARAVWALVLVLGMAAALGLGTRLTDREPRRDDGLRLTDHLATTSERVPLARLGPGPSLDPDALANPGVAGFTGLGPLLLEARLDERLRRDRSGDDLHALGLVRLFEGRGDDAVALLEEAALASPSGGDALTDLAAARIELGFETGQASQFLRALEAAIGARARDPDAPAARFNLALAMDELGLEHRAVDAWEEYLEADHASEWAAAARRRLDFARAAAEGAGRAALRDEVEARLAADDSESASKLLEEHSARARNDVMEVVLGDWAEAVAGGRTREAARILRYSRLVGDVAALRNRDGLVQDAVASIDRASRQGGEHFPVLVAAHRELARGIAARRSRDCEEAEGRLAGAAARLGRAGNPLAYLARLHFGVCLYFRDAPAAAAFFDELRAELADEHYPGLLARAHWMLGLAEAAAGDLWSARQRYEAARQVFQASDDPAGAAAVDGLLAEVHRRLGRHELAWSARLGALRTLSALGDTEGVGRTLEETVIALVAQGRTAAALVFQAEQIDRAGTAESPALALAYAHMLRARLLRSVGRRAEALESIEEARASASGLPPGVERQRLHANLDAEEGLILAVSRPERALPKLDAMIAVFGDSGHDLRFPELFHGRALARRALGDVDRAEADLLRAIGLAERRRGATGDGRLRVSMFEEVQPLYDEAVRYYLEDRSDPVRALQVADRARSRGLRDRASAVRELAGTERPSDPELLAGGEQRPPSVPSGVVLLVYGVLPERLVIWVVRGSDTEVVQVDVEAGELQREVRRLDLSIDSGGRGEAVQDRSGALFDRLIRPVLPLIDGVPNVVVVPDRFLATVPFAALYDRRSGRFLIEAHTVAVAPGVSFLEQGDGRTAAASPPGSALVLGDPEMDRRRFSHLEELDGSQIEARSVAELYPRAEVLLGPRASPERLVESLQDHRVLHLAAHTYTDASRRTRLVLTPDDRNADGLFDPSSTRPEAFARLDVAVLSACTTAGSHPSSDREALAGPATAFLAAGVPSVVASLWRIEDRRAADLAIAFHRGLASGVSPAAALREAQLSFLAHPEPERRSPASWGAFQLFTGRFPASP